VWRPAVERLRTWTQGQTLPREAYRVIVGCDCKKPCEESELASLLAATDGLIRLPNAWIKEDLSAEVGNFAIEHDEQCALAALSRRWFAIVFREWEGHWPRVQRAGFAIAVIYSRGLVGLIRATANLRRKFFLRDCTFRE
jgi:hypothetical protein